MLANKARTVTRRDGEIVMGRLIAAPFPFGHAAELVPGGDELQPAVWR